MKKCNFCWEQIQDSAKKCRHCWEWLETEKTENSKPFVVNKLKNFLEKIHFRNLRDWLISLLRRFVWIIVFLIVVYWINFLYGGQSDAYKKAHNLLLSRDYVSALAEYDKYIEKYPNDYKGYNDKSLILFRDRKFEDALKVINTIDTSKLTSNNKLLSTIESNKCLFYFSLMRYDLAKESCQKSLQYEPANSIALLNSATLYSTLKDNTRAWKFVDDSITYWNQTKREEMFEFYWIDQAYNIKGFILYNEWKNKEALEYYDKAISKNPLNAYAHSNKALLLTKEWKNEEALELINKALNLESKEWLMYQVKWYILSELWKDEEAIIYYDKALSIIPKDFTTNYTKALSLFILWKYQEAYDISLKIENYQKSPEEEIYVSENIAIQCISLVALEKYEDWLKKCDKFLKDYNPKTSEDNSTYLMVLDYKWIALAWLDRVSEARKIFQEVLRINPEDEIANQVLN